MRRSWLAAIVVIALAVAAAGCGGSDNASETNPTEEWASGFCTAVTDWKDSIANIQSDVTASPSRDALESAAGDARSATDTLVSELKDLGAPDTESGDAVKSAVDSFSETLDNEVSAIEDTAQGVSGIADLPGAVSTIAASLSTIGTSVSDALTTVDQADSRGELKTAFENTPECNDLSS